MDKSIPQPAARLLDFIASKEAPQGYDTVFGNNQKKMPKRLTSMTFDEVVADGQRRTREYGSSACGRYQFMRNTLDKANTLADIKGEMRLVGTEKFTPDLQDRMAFHLLKRRGYEKFISGKLSVTGFGLNLAKEWASFPVLKAVQGAHRKVSRGQSYYVGDGLNKALVPASEVETVLNAMLSLPSPAVPVEPVSSPVGLPVTPAKSSVGGLLASLWAKLRPPASAAPGASVTKGDPVVYSVQSQLKARGYYLNGLLDGIDGTKTRDAVAASRKDNGLGDGGIDADYLAKLPTFGKRPVSELRTATSNQQAYQLAKQQAPELAQPVGFMWKAGAALLGLGGAGAANDGGLLDSIKSAGDQANDALGTVNAAFATVAQIVQFCVTHWKWIAVAVGLYLILRAASYALNFIIKFRQAFF